MATPQDARLRAASTYNAAADTYDDPVNSFWERYGQRTIARLYLRPAAQVLDVCCGSGASALPAAEAVGPGGTVLGVDLAENLLALARAKAKQRGFHNTEFRSGDMLDLRVAPAQFDAVVCVFGIFFVPDMEAAARYLWSLVRPGGQLAITTWGPRFFEPVNTVFWNAVRSERADLYKGFNPWDRVSEPQALSEIFFAAGAQGANVIADAGYHSLKSPDDWWPMVLGTGYRGTIERLDSSARERIRRSCLEFIRVNGTQVVEANVVYGAATKHANALA